MTFVLFPRKIMFFNRNVISVARRTEEEKLTSPMRDAVTLMGVCFAFGVLGWYLVSPLL